MSYFEREQIIPASVDRVFAFFSEATNLEAITPPWLDFHILTRQPVIVSGTVMDYRLRLHGFPIRWRARIESWDPPHGFKDVQLQGPYRLWEHEHRFERAPGGTRMRDRVRYELPLGPIGWVADRLWVRRELARIFDYRATKIGLLWRLVA